MKRHKLFVLTLIGFLITALYACKEVPPAINFNPNTTSTDTGNISNQKHNVLLEEITGVRCVNCPEGHVVAEGIAAAHPAGSVVIIAIHAGQFAVPYPGVPGQSDLEIPQGVDINNLVGPATQFPSADVNRVLFTGQQSKFLAPASIWAGYANNELLDTLTPVKIGLTPTYSDASRQLNLSVSLLYTQNMATANNLSVMIAESGIIGPQEVPSGVDTFYNQRHVLRGMLTPSSGQIISGNKAPGTPLNISFNSFAIPSTWNADSCTIIAFVTQGTDSVLQVVETPMKK